MIFLLSLCNIFIEPQRYDLIQINPTIPFGGLLFEIFARIESVISNALNILVAQLLNISRFVDKEYIIFVMENSHTSDEKSLQVLAAHLQENPKFQERVLQSFDHADRNRDGLLLMSEVLQYADTLKTLTNKSDADVKPLRDVLREFYGACGVTETGIKREDWVEKISVFVARERELMNADRHDEMLLRKLSDTFFNVIDVNKDGSISINELIIMAKAYEWPVDQVPHFFKMADKNQNGKIEREEYYALLTKFWYEVKEGEIDNLFGYLEYS